MSASLLLLAALSGLAVGLGIRAAKPDRERPSGPARSLQWAVLLLSPASVGLPLWVALGSGSLRVTHDVLQTAAALVATAALTLAIPWLRRNVPLRGAALVMTLAGAGVVVAAGMRLSTLCGEAPHPSALCLDPGRFMPPAWVAAGALLLLPLGFFALRRANLPGWRLASSGNFASPQRHALDEMFEDHPPGTGGIAGSGGPTVPMRRRGRIPGRLTVRATARGHGTVGEYSVSTDLPDRTGLARWLDLSIAQARLAETSCAVLLVQIAEFREVDEVVEVRADDILAQDAGALAQAALEPHDFLARLARDEFAVGVPEMVHQSRANELGARLLGSLAEFVAARGLQMQIGVNIGIAIYPRDAQTSEALMQAARVSLSEARESGSNQVRVFNSAAGERARRMRVIRRDLWLAIQDDGLALQYQPKFDVRQRTVIGAEALCRWRHPTLGQVNPAEFITVAEQSGQIDKLDDWVIATVCRQIRQWQDDGIPVVPVAINVSGLRFASRDFPQYLLEQIHQHDIPPSAVTLEITETAAMKDIAQSLETLLELQALGIHVALDDFGSGYSSLGYLKRLRVGTLKIDRTLIGGLDVDAQGRAIVGSMVALAHELKMRVVAEGVESHSQLDILAGMGCDEAQGYLLSHPLDPVTFANLLSGA
ncbi:putative bifunctional diguanylate cyclase/phosphodiesterase [Cupriavidus basilensis]|uniref:putative bifunctional diguanylate cyclase/phosphodiesterase n=1 Tax=Cupriavidus basilensis TaxID=68895 RepID=UPI002851EA5B|nr:bifunctional diguanylate cyclase/phosphodiesterase [Cupriavidus basilensis]MDR3380828.1 bifunctional diguanylate cyclase/phosphodiesterase [Cupriavidus basilensis]